MARSIAAVGAGWLGAAAVLAAALGALGASTEVLTPYLGFRTFSLGVLLAAPAFGLGLLGLARTRVSAGRAGRGPAVLGTASGAGLLAIVLVAALPSRGVPIINDITTDPASPPRFEVAAHEVGDPLVYPGEPFATKQRDGYPDLAPLELELPPPRALERAEAAAREIGLEVVAVDHAAGTLEARETSTVFRFVDDVAVRVTPSGSGSRVDVRSRSRVGRGDLGQNAARIRRLLDAIR